MVVSTKEMYTARVRFGKMAVNTRVNVGMQLPDSTPAVQSKTIASSPVRMYRKSYCTTPGVGVCDSGGGVDKMLKFKVFL